MTHVHQPVVYRQLAIPVSTFDRIKDYQRHHEATKGQRLSLVQTIAAIVRDQQLNEEGVSHDRTSKQQPAILRSH
jgi:hypothetical protein